MLYTIAQDRVSRYQKRFMYQPVRREKKNTLCGLLIENDTDRESLIIVAECVLGFLIYFICLNLHTSGPDKTAIHTPNEPCEPPGM